DATLLETVRRASDKLYGIRAQRVWPGRDEKILTSWNGLMLRAFAEGAIAFDRQDLLETAVRNATFLRDNLYRNGQLLRSYKDGEARLNGFLEDFPYLGSALTCLSEPTFDDQWLRWADVLAQSMLTEFADEQNGAFCGTAIGHKGL